MPLVPLTVGLNTDAGNRRFNGPNGKIFAGTNTTDPDYALAHVLLVDASNNPLVVAVDLDSGAGTANRMGMAVLVAASGGPAVITGDAANGLDVDVTRLPAISPGTAAANLGKAEDTAHVSGDVGVMALGVRQDTPTALATPSGDYTPFKIDPLGGMWVRQQTVAASVDVALASTAASQQVLAANAARRGLLLTNTDANDVYLYYGTTATATKFTVKIPTNGYWEMPQPIYTGRIDALWAADGAGSLIGSEL